MQNNLGEKNLESIRCAPGELQSSKEQFQNCKMIKLATFLDYHKDLNYVDGILI